MISELLSELRAGQVLRQVYHSSAIVPKGNPVKVFEDLATLALAGRLLYKTLSPAER